MEIVVTNRAESGRELHGALERFAAENQVPAEALQAMDLALEEHFANLLEHAYPGGGYHQIRVRFARAGNWLEVEVEDDGREFNPLLAPEPDISLPLEERPIGGLGIHLMKQFLDELEYRREGVRNLVRLRKRLEQVSPGG